jgi:hypothetical protein
MAERIPLRRCTGVIVELTTPARFQSVMASRTCVTRRTLLAAAGGVSGVVVLGGCPAKPERSAGESGAATAHGGDLIYVTTELGASVLDQSGRVVTPPTKVAAATPGWGRVVIARPDGAGTVVEVADLATRQVAWAHRVSDVIEPRIVSATGDLVASVTPGGAGVYGLHDPGGRDRTTLVVCAATGERARLDLPGNIEPDVFSPDGSLLFVLDYVPAAAPQQFRPRVVDLATGRLTPLSTRAGTPIPDGAEPLTRAHRLDGIVDPRRDLYFALYSYQEDAVAFVQCVHLRERWTHRVALPAPFGQERPGVHAIVLSPSGDRLTVVHSPSASVADVDPDRLVVSRVGRFASSGQEGKPTARITASGRLVVSVDRSVYASDPHRAIPTLGETRGLALGRRDDVWAGHPAGLVHLDLATGAELGRIAVRDLFTVKHVRGPA